MKLGFGKPKQKEESEQAAPESIIATRLRALSGDDVELYGAMSHLMFLDPKKILVPLEDVVKDAEAQEARGNKLRAEVAYRIAGGISLSRGDVGGVNTYFSKAASLAGDSHPEYQVILKRSTQAVAIAQKYYAEFGMASPIG
jgi:hypothetical protein